MGSKPFRFLDSPADVAHLRQALARANLTVATTSGLLFDEANPYRPAQMRFSCPWLSEQVELEWNFNWWPDGTNSELDHINIIYGGVVRGRIIVETRIRERLGRPLRDVIVDEVDLPIAGLLQDLKQRGLLDDTLRCTSISL
jgi:hypothetical protein